MKDMGTIEMVMYARVSVISRIAIAANVTAFFNDQYLFLQFIGDPFGQNGAKESAPHNEVF
jgi:hypothetical protein